MPITERILVVDDVETIRSLIKAALSDEGYQVDTAADGEEAIAKLRTEHYDLVVTDFQMPRRSGTDVAREVRNLGLRIPVLILTADTMEDHEELLRIVGVNLTLQKPVSLEELYDAVDRSIRDREEERREVGRMTLSDSCVIVSGGREIPGELRTLGAKGASVRIEESPNLSGTDYFELRITFPSGEINVKMEPKSEIQGSEGDIIIGGEFVDLSPEDMEKIRQRLTTA